MDVLLGNARSWDPDSRSTGKRIAAHVRDRLLIETQRSRDTYRDGHDTLGRFGDGRAELTDELDPLRFAGSDRQRVLDIARAGE